MDTVPNREIISTKDIVALGFGRSKAQRMYSAMRKAKRARLDAENPGRIEKDAYLFIDDLVAELGIPRVAIIRQMVP